MFTRAQHATSVTQMCKMSTRAHHATPSCLWIQSIEKTAVQSARSTVFKDNSPTLYTVLTVDMQHCTLYWLYSKKSNTYSLLYWLYSKKISNTYSLLYWLYSKKISNTYSLLYWLYSKKISNTYSLLYWLYSKMISNTYSLLYWLYSKKISNTYSLLYWLYSKKISNTYSLLYWLYSKKKCNTYSLLYWLYSKKICNISTRRLYIKEDMQHQRQRFFEYSQSTLFKEDMQHLYSFSIDCIQRLYSKKISNTYSLLYWLYSKKKCNTYSLLYWLYSKKKCNIKDNASLNTVNRLYSKKICNISTRSQLTVFKDCIQRRYATSILVVSHVKCLLERIMQRRVEMCLLLNTLQHTATHYNALSN